MRKRNAGKLGLAPRQCICDPMDLAALGHMLNCPCNPRYKAFLKDNPRYEAFLKDPEGEMKR